MALNSLSIVLLWLLPCYVSDCIITGKLRLLLGSSLKIIGQLGRRSGELSFMPYPRLLYKQLECQLLRPDWSSWFWPDYLGSNHGLSGLHSQLGLTRWIFDISVVSHSHVTHVHVVEHWEYYWSSSSSWSVAVSTLEVISYIRLLVALEFCHVSGWVLGNREHEIKSWNRPIMAVRTTFSFGSSTYNTSRLNRACSLGGTLCPSAWCSEGTSPISSIFVPQRNIRQITYRAQWKSDRH